MFDTLIFCANWDAGLWPHSSCTYFWQTMLCVLLRKRIKEAEVVVWFANVSCVCKCFFQMIMSSWVSSYMRSQMYSSSSLNRKLACGLMDRSGRSQTELISPMRNKYLINWTVLKIYPYHIRPIRGIRVPIIDIVRIHSLKFSKSHYL